LVGPSGCGKTSLLRVIAGFEVPTAGRVEVAGECLVGPGCWIDPEKRRVGMVFQQGALFPHLDVMGNVLYGLRGSAQAKDLARAALRRVGMEDRQHRFPDQLSGGEQQRVALARAMAPAPRLILLDEPFASLDASLRRELRDEVRSVLKAAGCTALLVTHDQEEALSLADWLVVMGDGRVLQSGSPDAVYNRPASLEVAHFIGDGQCLACRVTGGNAHTALGQVPCRGEDGPGQLWVRPEDLALLPVEAGVGILGVLRQRVFYGHDLVDSIELSANPQAAPLAVRNIAGAPFEVGDKVRLRLKEKPFVVFPPSESA
jgi:iron(III) transport system ATP-binding protein